MRVWIPLNCSTWIFAFFCLVFFVLSAIHPIISNDFWFHAQAGQTIDATHALPNSIEYAFGAIKHRFFLVHSWLPSWWLYIGISKLGYYGFSWVKCLLLLGLSCLVFAFAYQQTHKKTFSALLMVFVTVTLGSRSCFRPELFSLFYFTAMMWSMRLFTQRSQYRYVFLSLMIQCLWVNSHPSFWVGLYIPGVFALHDLCASNKSAVVRDIGSAFLPWSVIILSFLTISLLNPYGLALHEHIFRGLLFSSAIHQYTYEWFPLFKPMFFGSLWWILRLTTWMIGVALVLRFYRKMPLWSLLLPLPFFILTLCSHRFSIYLSFALILPMVECCAWLWSDRYKTLYQHSASVILLACSVFYYHVYGLWSWPFLTYHGDLSKESILYIHGSDIEGAVWNQPSLGGQLTYFFYPKIQVTIDGRLDTYGDVYLDAIKTMFMGSVDHVDQFFKKNKIKTMFISPKDLTFLKEKHWYDWFKRSGWYIDFEDKSLVVLRKKDV